MRKVIISALLVASCIAYAQDFTPNNYSSSYSSTMSVNSLGGDHAVFGVRSENFGRALKYNEIAGSPYYNAEFHLANVAENVEKVPVRYNSYKDEVEFQKEGKPLVLPKEEQFSRIEIISPKSTIVLLKTNDDLSGYFFELVSGKIPLYKKIKVKFQDAIPAANSYATDKAAFFKTLDPVYYIKTESGYIKKTKKVRDIADAFPAKKDEIEKFVKSNNIKINKEEDLIKLVKFLNQ
ncbi:hypothetical protein [Chryseobacterium indologenes]|uniref:hypothetical protein n=1 Tax=Chryseobacterium indologenes TaxID=253 RepID=UPI001BCF9E50|nr:hypothetical protein [Chryseobacterium indologenes]